MGHHQKKKAGFAQYVSIKQNQRLWLGLSAGAVWALLLIQLTQSEQVAGNTYSTIRDGDWSEASTWASGSPPPASIHSDDTLKISHAVNFDEDYELTGAMVISPGSQLSGQKNLLIEADGYLLNQAWISVKKMENEGTLENKGLLELSKTFDNSQGILSNEDSLYTENFTGNDGGSFENTGSFGTKKDFHNESGTFSNTGNVWIGDDLHNKGGGLKSAGFISVADDLKNEKATLFNDGELHIGKDLINSSGSFSNFVNGILGVGRDVKNNPGTLINEGDFSIGRDLKNNTKKSQLTNDGTLSVAEDVLNSNGVITNQGLLSVGNELDADNNSLLNGNGGFFDACGSIDMHNKASSRIQGTVTVCQCDGLTDPVSNPGTIASTVQVCSSVLSAYSFTVIAEGKADLALLRWHTQAEPEPYVYVIEKSTDTVFSPIAEIPGQGQAQNDYTYTDVQVLGGITYLYRVTARSPSGAHYYAPQVEVRIPPRSKSQVRVWPNPWSGGPLKIAVGGELRLPLKVSLRNLQGGIVYTQEWQNLPSHKQIEFALPTRPLPGPYVLMVRDQGQFSHTEKLMITR